MDRIEAAGRKILNHGGETSAALVVIGYAPGLSNDTLRRILRLSHPGAVRLVDKLAIDGLVERRAGLDGRQVALHLTRRGKQMRSHLLASRLGVIARVIASLDSSEKRALSDLVQKLLEQLETTETERFTICRMCDAQACDNCPLPKTNWSAPSASDKAKNAEL